eukprot:TRINITY_DN40636_c0_g1_i1.p1 TRINITY_DN40636_c0_g1~~TRINITY_DN40636_c0_g1_i1.p1  ORF type:complete len:122 (+),score=27.23 TRINITY_DN40636_c0_g1_i1:131-496(+)
MCIRDSPCTNLLLCVSCVLTSWCAGLGAAKQAVCAVPDVVRHCISAEDEFIVLACDGVFDVKSSQQVVDFIREGLVEPSKVFENCTPTLERLLDECCATEIVSDGVGLDNMSIAIIFLPRS